MTQAMTLNQTQEIICSAETTPDQLKKQISSVNKKDVAVIFQLSTLEIITGLSPYLDVVQEFKNVHLVCDPVTGNLPLVDQDNSLYGLAKMGARRFALETRNLKTELRLSDALEGQEEIKMGFEKAKSEYSVQKPANYAFAY